MEASWWIDYVDKCVRNSLPSEALRLYRYVLEGGKLAPKVALTEDWRVALYALTQVAALRTMIPLVIQSRAPIVPEGKYSLRTLTVVPTLHPCTPLNNRSRGDLSMILRLLGGRTPEEVRNLLPGLLQDCMRQNPARLSVTWEDDVKYMESVCGMLLGGARLHHGVRSGLDVQVGSWILDTDGMTIPQSVRLVSAAETAWRQGIRAHVRISSKSLPMLFEALFGRDYVGESLNPLQIRRLCNRKGVWPEVYSSQEMADLLQVVRDIALSKHSDKYWWLIADCRGASDVVALDCILRRVRKQQMNRGVSTRIVPLCESFDTVMRAEEMVETLVRSGYRFPHEEVIVLYAFSDLTKRCGIVSMGLAIWYALHGVKRAADKHHLKFTPFYGDGESRYRGFGPDFFTLLLPEGVDSLVATTQGYAGMRNFPTEYAAFHRLSGIASGDRFHGEVTTEMLEFAREAATRLQKRWSDEWLHNEQRASLLARLLQSEDLRFLRWGSRPLYRPGQEGNLLVAARAIPFAAGQALNNLPLVALVGLEELQSFGAREVARMIELLPPLQLGLGAVKALSAGSLQLVRESANQRAGKHPDLVELFGELDRSHSYLQTLLATSGAHIPDMSRNVFSWEVIGRLQQLRLQAEVVQGAERRRRGVQARISRLSDDFAHAIFAAMGGAA